MRITVRQAHNAHGASGPVADYIGEVIPLRIGEAGFAAVLESVTRMRFSDDVLCTFYVPDAELVWSVLGNGRSVTMHAPHAGA